MRFKKGRGKIKDCITMTELDIIQACYEFLERKEKYHKTLSTSRIKIPCTKEDKLNKLGRKMPRRGVEVQIDVESK